MTLSQRTTYFLAAAVAFIVVNVLRQVLLRSKNEPPLVFHWLPYLGNVITYGMDPVNFFFRCREKVST